MTKSYNCSDECDLILANQLLTHISFCFCNTRLVITYLYGSFLINKRPASISPTRNLVRLCAKSLILVLNRAMSLLLIRQLKSVEICSTLTTTNFFLSSLRSYSRSLPERLSDEARQLKGKFSHLVVYSYFHTL